MFFFEMARIYCWVLEREVEVNGDCRMMFGGGSKGVINVCPWKNSRVCPLRMMKAISKESRS